MKILFIGGTGTISTAISKRLVEMGEELYLINRGNKNDELPEGIHYIIGDINDEEAIKEKIKDLTFDAVCDFIGFVPSQLERDYRLFKGKTRQFMYISSASAYHKPVCDYRITEGTSLNNPYWEYSRNKIACEEYLMKLSREEGFPVTIIRPSHTYNEKSVPLGVHGSNGSFQVIKRMLEGKQVIVQGDGTSLWTMTDSRDFAKAFVGLIGNAKAIGEVFQITTDESLTWNQIYSIIADALGVEYRPYYVASDFLAAVAPAKYDLLGGLVGDKSNSVVFDNSKVKSAVPGYRADITMSSGIRRTVEYVMSHPECQVADEEYDKWCDDVIATLENAKKMLTK